MSETYIFERLLQKLELLNEHITITPKLLKKLIREILEEKH